MGSGVSKRIELARGVTLLLPEERGRPLEVDHEPGCDPLDPYATLLLMQAIATIRNTAPETSADALWPSEGSAGLPPEAERELTEAVYRGFASARAIVAARDLHAGSPVPAPATDWISLADVKEVSSALRGDLDDAAARGKPARRGRPTWRWIWQLLRGRDARRASAREIIQAMAEDELSTREYLVLDLEIEGLDDAEIAARLGTTENDVRQIRHRRRAKIQRALG